MKTISFSVVDILPALLDRSKMQTIRKAWWKPDLLGESIVKGDMADIHFKTFLCENKPARFEVGDLARLYWKQRSKYEYFCTHCGERLPIYDGTIIQACYNECFKAGDFLVGNAFHKNIAEVDITEVFKIIMCVEDDLEHYWEDQIGEEGFVGIGTVHGWIKILGDFDGAPDDKELAKMDGFKDSKEMFEWFNKQYDLSRPKPFWVYRWKYLKSPGGD